jgi:hypothetical protein
MAIPTTNYAQIRTNLNLNFNNAYSSTGGVGGVAQSLSISRGLRVVDAYQVSVVQGGAGNNDISRVRAGVVTQLFLLSANTAAGTLTRATAIATPASAELASGDLVTFAGLDANQRAIAIVDVIPYSIP